MTTTPDSQSGFSMIEVLVSLMLIVFGLLGLLGLQARAQVAELESYQRGQALILVQDMVNRINTNRSAAGCYVSATPLGTGFTTTPVCNTGSGGPTGNTVTQGIAVADLTDWDSMLDGASETRGGINVGSIIGARGCVSLNSGVYRVAVAWQGMASTVSPAAVDAAATCGQNLYGTDTLRREVSVSFRMANLGI